MSAQTVVTIESAIAGAAEGGGVADMVEIRDLLQEWISSPDHQAFMKQEEAMRFFKEFPARIAAWVERIKYLRQSNLLYLKEMVKGGQMGTEFEAAMSRIAAEEAFVSHAARMATLDAAAAASEGTLVAGIGTTIAVVVVPVVAMIAVQVALGAGYYQARELARKDGYESGFGRGFITGLLNWELRFTIDRFWDGAVDKNPYDEELPRIRANAHNQALIHGRAAGLAKRDGDKKNYLLGLRKLTNASSAGWSPRSDDWMERARARNVQVGYVIELAGAAKRSRIIQTD